MSQSDFCILYPHLATMLLKQTIDPRRAIDLNITASLEFLAKVMPEPIAPFHRSLVSENPLETPCIQELPSEHQPDTKWTAMRLKIPHEARSRMLPKVRRKLKRFGGLVGDDREVWMHIAPSVEELERRGLQALIRNTTGSPHRLEPVSDIQGS